MVKTRNDLLLHPIDYRRMLYDLKTKFCCFLVLFDKVEFAMVFEVEVAQITTQLDILL